MTAGETALFLERFGEIMIGFFVICAFVCVILTVSMWKLFVKCGREGWESLIPIYNAIVLSDIAEVEAWMIFIPVVNLYWLYQVAESLTNKFSKSSSFKWLFFFLPYVGIAMLGLGNSYPVDDELAALGLDANGKPLDPEEDDSSSK